VIDLDDPPTLARFLVGLGYDDTKIRDTLARCFPTADVDRILADAQAQVRDSNQQVNDQLDAEARRAEHEEG
jgi:hypothetical protein